MALYLMISLIPLQFEMGESNGTVALSSSGRHEVTLNRPTDPFNLPAADKSKAYLHFILTSDSTQEQVNVVVSFLFISD